MKEPDIQFYAKLEKRSIQRSIIAELEDNNGKLYSDDKNLIRIATQYYRELYTPTPFSYTNNKNSLKMYTQN